MRRILPHLQIYSTSVNVRGGEESPYDGYVTGWQWHDDLYSKKHAEYPDQKTVFLFTTNNIVDVTNNNNTILILILMVHG